MYRPSYIIALLSLLVSCNTPDSQQIPPSSKSDSIIADKNSDNRKMLPSTTDIEEEEEDFPDRIFKWKGTINGSINIHGQYQIANGYMDSKMDIIIGELIYDKVGSPIQLIGQLSEDRKRISLLEIAEDGNITGMLSGNWDNGHIKEGSWFSPINRNDFSLHIKASPKEDQDYSELRTDNIVGKYHYRYGKEGPVGTLLIKSVKDNKVTLDLICLTKAPGRNNAVIEDIELPIQNNTIRVNWQENCVFDIRLFDGFAVIDYIDNKTDCMFGHNAHVSGFFKKIKN